MVCTGCDGECPVACSSTQEAIEKEETVTVVEAKPNCLIVIPIGKTDALELILSDQISLSRTPMWWRLRWCR